MKTSIVRLTVSALLASFLSSFTIEPLAVAQRDDVVPLPQAHAHNDYYHKRPLLDALDCGFCSVEADIFLVDGKLLVAHDKWSLRKNRTLQQLYLDPLKTRVEKNDGKVYRNGPIFTLLIDIKENGNQVYPVLKKLLVHYEPILSGIRNGRYEHRAIQIVISGNCPRKLIADDPVRMVSIDGRLSDLDSDAPVHLIPMISSRWSSSFKWRGKSQITAEQTEKLQSIVSKAHAKERRVRFWATPDTEAVWDKLLSVDIDHINTDDLQMLNAYLMSKRKER